MEQQSGNNFDALFQKAAEEYPLKTDNSNWNVVAGKLNTHKTSSLAGKSKKWQYAAMLLLLLAAGGFFYWNNKPVSGVSNLSRNQTVINSNKAEKSSVNHNQVKEILIAKNLHDQQNNTSLKNSFPKQSNNNNPVLNNSISKTQFRKPESFATFKNRNKTSGISSVASQQSQTSANLPFASLNNSVPKTADAINNKTIAQLNTESTQNNETKNKNTDNLKSTESQHIKLVPQPKLFYGELFFAPDFSTVKLQNVNAPGYKAGVAIGYKISKRFSAELGLERLHTDFYSNAKYLDKSHLKLKPNTTVQFVNGKSKLTEVPIDIKYNLSKNNDHFFVTLGTTVARITHTEKYNYRVIKDGTQHEASKHFGALTGTEFFSDINLSAGYQTKLSGSFSLRAEPYYQVPLKGLGVGNLPVTNFGVSIGIVKDLK